MKRMKYHDSPAALVSGVSCLVFLRSLLHYGFPLLTEKDHYEESASVSHATNAGLCPAKASGNSCPELHTKRAIFSHVWSSLNSAV